MEIAKAFLIIGEHDHSTGSPPISVDIEQNGRTEEIETAFSWGVWHTALALASGMLEDATEPGQVADALNHGVSLVRSGVVDQSTILHKCGEVLEALADADPAVRGDFEERGGVAVRGRRSYRAVGPLPSMN